MSTGCATAVHAYRRDVLDRIVADMQAQAPDHIAVTGDLANIGLPQEHINALAWLRELGRRRSASPSSPATTTSIPASAPIPARGAGGRTCRRMRAGARLRRRTARIFPLCAGSARWRSIGVNSAVPTPPLIAWGEVGTCSNAIGLRAFSTGSAATSCSASCSSIIRRCRGRHPCRAACAMRRRCSRCWRASGAELVIHGHNHHNMLAWRAPLRGRCRWSARLRRRLAGTHRG